MPPRFSKSGHGDRCRRLKGCDYGGSAAYFITIVCNNRLRLFGSWYHGCVHLNSLGRLAGRIWAETPKHFPGVTLDAWVVMPNHFHSVVVLNGNHVGMERWGQGMPWPHPVFRASPSKKRRGVDSQSLGAVIGSFKSAVTKQINLLRNTPGAKVWQSSYYDHLIRSPDALERIRTYIKLNPTGGRRI